MFVVRLNDRLGSAPPITRSSLRVSDGQDLDVRVEDEIDDAIWKAQNFGGPDIGLEEDRELRRRLGDPNKGRVDGIDETSPTARIVLLVVAKVGG